MPNNLCKAQDRCDCLLQGLLQRFPFPLGKQGSGWNCSRALCGVCGSKTDNTSAPQQEMLDHRSLQSGKVQQPASLASTKPALST